MATYKLKMPQSNQTYDIYVLGIGTKYLTVAFVNNDVTELIAKKAFAQKFTFLEIIEVSDDNSSKTLKTPPASFVKLENPNFKTYQINFDSPQHILTPATQQQQIQLELRRADENDRANVSKLLTTINDITFGVQKDKMQSANKNSEAVRSLL